MRIAFVHNSGMTFWPMRGDLVRAVQERGHEIVACLPKYEPSSSATAKEFGVQLAEMPLDPVGFNPIKDWQYFKALNNFFLHFKPEVIFSTTIKAVIYASIAAAKMKPRPLIASMINGLGYAFAPKHTLISSMIRMLYKNALNKNDTLFFLNSDDRELFDSLKLIQKKHRVIQLDGSGINLDQFQFKAAESSKISFLFVGRLIRDKGIGEFVGAARLMKKYFPNLQFEIVGYLDSHPSAVTEAEVRAWTKEGFLNYRGPQNDVRPFLRSCSVFVLPSYREGTSRAALEAMATGRAIITTNAPGCRQTVEEGINGWLVPAKDVTALVEAMKKFVRNPDLIQTMGQASRKIVEEKFDMRKVNSKIIEALGL